jgi:hypothetical protein
MGMRFQVLINARSVCIAGIDGDGVLSVCLDRTQRPGKDERLALHVGGLGRYHPQLEKNSHVRWSVPEEMKPGDELAIRILAAGEYDDPLEVRPSPSAEIEDPVFGPLSYYDSARCFRHHPPIVLRGVVGFRRTFDFVLDDNR